MSANKQQLLKKISNKGKKMSMKEGKHSDIERLFYWVTLKENNNNFVKTKVIIFTTATKPHGHPMAIWFNTLFLTRGYTHP